MFMRRGRWLLWSIRIRIGIEIKIEIEMALSSWNGNPKRLVSRTRSIRIAKLGVINDK